MRGEGEILRQWKGMVPKSLKPTGIATCSGDRRSVRQTINQGDVTGDKDYDRTPRLNIGRNRPRPLFPVGSHDRSMSNV